VDPQLEQLRAAWLSIDRALLARYEVATEPTWHVDERGHFTFVPALEHEVVRALLARSRLE
jgi:hypothetical protein